MSFSQENGYVPQSINEIVAAFRTRINSQFGTSYTTAQFVGTNFYKYFYSIAQELQKNEVKTAEIFLKLQDYFNLTNERISRPVNTNPGLIEIMATNGYLASIKKPIDADAGKMFICVDVDDEADGYAETKLAICKIIQNSTVGGIVTQGTEVETIVLSNGQSFDFKYDLPDRIEVHLKLTITLSSNNQVLIASPDESRFKLLGNIASRYALGKNFEPKRYFSVADAPWASDILLEWSVNGGDTWSSAVFVADYDELFDIALDRIEIVEA
jgi:hypothetical protein